MVYNLNVTSVIFPVKSTYMEGIGLRGSYSDAAYYNVGLLLYKPYFSIKYNIFKSEITLYHIFRLGYILYWVHDNNIIYIACLPRHLKNTRQFQYRKVNNIIFVFLLGKSIGTRVFYYFLELYNNIINVHTWNVVFSIHKHSVHLQNEN